MHDGRFASLEVSLGSSLSAVDYVVHRGDAEVSSGSMAQLEVTKSLVSDVSSGSTLRYSDDPAKVDVEKDISSSVSKRSY